MSSDNYRTWLNEKFPNLKEHEYDPEYFSDKFVQEILESDAIELLHTLYMPQKLQEKMNKENAVYEPNVEKN